MEFVINTSLVRNTLINGYHCAEVHLIKFICLEYFYLLFKGEPNWFLIIICVHEREPQIKGNNVSHLKLDCSAFWVWHILSKNLI